MRRDAPCPLSGQIQLHLLGGFRATQQGQDYALPPSTWRLIAFLAIVDRPVDRAHAANVLWCDKSEERAQANLRSCLWRVRRSGGAIVTCTPTHIQLGSAIRVDVRDFINLAYQIVDNRSPIDLDDIDTTPFAAELLPDWYDDFVEFERERFRQLRLHALESLALRLSRSGRRDRALDVALTAVAAAPLRESAHRVVISIHLDEGNVSEALRHYDSMSGLLRRQLCVEPSSEIRDLVAAWRGPGARPTPRVNLVDALTPAAIIS